MTNNFADYVRHGWALCYIHEGEKAPRGERWNTRDKAITSVERAEHLSRAGLMHAYSGTCAIDMDHIELARTWFAEHGIDLEAMLNAPDAVRTHSGDPSRAKLFYRLPVPLNTKMIRNADKTKTIVELRCGTTTGRTQQDILPPSINPRTKQPYEWIGDWRKLPVLPADVHALWSSLVQPVAPDTPRPAPTADAHEVIAWAYEQDPDCSHDAWLDVGMVLHHELEGSDEGFAAWDSWSVRSETKYPGTEVLQTRWDSFGNSPTPKTFGSVLRERVATRDMFDDVPQAGEDNAFAQAEREAAQAQLDAAAAEFQWRSIEWIVTQPDPVWLVHDLLPQSRDMLIVAGVPGVGKSFLALDASLALVRGTPWFGADTVQGPVAYLAAEAFGTFNTRLRAYLKTHNLPRETPGFHLLDAGINLTDTKRVQALAQSAKGLTPRLLVIDTLAAVAGGVDHNSSEMQLVIDNAKLLQRALDTTVLLVAHYGKDDARGVMGWQGVTAAAETILAATKDEQGARQLKVIKQRNGIEGTRYKWSLDAVNVGLDAKDRPIMSATPRYLGLAAPVTVEQPAGSTLLALAREVLGGMCPLDGDPVVSLSGFIDAYAHNLANPPGGKDTRHTRAQSKLRELTERREVLVDNANDTITLLQRSFITPKQADSHDTTDLL